MGLIPRSPNPERPLSAEEYAALDEPDDVRSELVRGRLVREPRPGGVHGVVQAELTRRLGNHVRESGSGRVVTESGTIIARGPDTVRGPDVAFYSSERQAGPIPSSFFETPPDLAVEILSPSDRAGPIQAKVRDYLATGVRMVWVVDPEGWSATVYRSLTEIRLLAGEDALDGEDVLPGFRVALAELCESG